MGYTSIKGLTPGLAILGHIKIGKKGEKRQSRSGGEYRLPEKLDHFVITKREKGTDDNFIVDEELTKKIGADVKEVDIRLLYDEIDLNFPHRLACYATGQDLKKHFNIDSKTKRCYCTGDGEEATRLDDDGKKTITCDPTTCPIFNGKVGDLKCKPLGRLIFTLPAMNFVGGCFDFVSTSQETIRNIKTSLMMIQSLTQGILAGIPLKLRMYASTDETGQGTVKNWKVMVAYEGSEQALVEETKQIASLRKQSYVDIKRIQMATRRAIEYVEKEEEGDIQEEFFPRAEEPKYECESTVLSEVNGLAEKLGYNVAKIQMLLGQYKGREAELVKNLMVEVAEKEKKETAIEVEAEVVDIPPSSEPETVENIRTEETSATVISPEPPAPPKNETLPAGPSVNELFPNDAPPLETTKEPFDAKKDGTPDYAAKRSGLVSDIAALKTLFTKKKRKGAFDKVRKKYADHVDMLSIGDLEKFKKELDEIGKGFGGASDSGA